MRKRYRRGFSFGLYDFYPNQVLECYDWCTGLWSVLTEKPDWVFGAELAAADGRLFTLGGVASR